MSDNDTKIRKLAKEYNEIEVEQEKRLFELFKELKKRKGYKRVTFSSGELWSNCWGWNDEITRKLVLNNFTRTIKEIEM